MIKENLKTIVISLVIGVIVGAILTTIFATTKIETLKTTLNTATSTIATQKTIIDTLTSQNAFLNKTFTQSGKMDFYPNGKIKTITWLNTGGEQSGSSSATGTHSATTGSSATTGTSSATSDNEKVTNPKVFFVTLDPGINIDRRDTLLGGDINFKPSWYILGAQYIREFGLTSSNMLLAKFGFGL